MKAAIIRKWGPPSVFEISTVEKPTPKDNQLLIKVFASGINPVDWKHRYGNHRFIFGSPFPIILGYDICGEVIEVGNECKTFKIGDIVFGDLDNKYGGGLAEYCVGHEQSFALKPQNISIEQAAGVSLASLTALQALRDKAHISEGKTVVINGASGGVGHVALQIAKIFNTKVIAIANGNKQEFVNQFMPDIFIDYTTSDPLKQIGKADIFFDITGNYSFLKVLKVLNPGGVYVTTLPRPKVFIQKLVQLFTKGKKASTLLRKHSQADMQLLATFISEGKLKIEIDRIFNIEDISNAHEYAEMGHSKGKNIIHIQ